MAAQQEGEPCQSWYTVDSRYKKVLQYSRDQQAWTMQTHTSTYPVIAAMCCVVRLTVLQLAEIIAHALSALLLG